MAEGILSAMDHIEIEPRLQNMGLLDPNENLIQLLENVIVPIQHGRLPASQIVSDAYGREISTTLKLFSSLVRLLPLGSLNMMLQEISCHISRIPQIVPAFEKTRQILSLFGLPMQICREDYHSKLMDVLSIVGLPHEYLQLEDKRL